MVTYNRVNGPNSRKEKELMEYEWVACVSMLLALAGSFTR